jgi:hypothetical protein
MASSKVVPTTESGQISFQVYQDVYNTLTGKSEKLSRNFFDRHKIKLSDIENLFHLFEQAFEQFDVQASNCTFTVSYANGKTDRYSSLEKFRLQAPAKPACTEDIEIEYDVLLKLPKLDQPKSYKIIVFVRSDIGVEERFRLSNVSEFEKIMFRDIAASTARYEIQYIDVAVARTIESAIEDWYANLPRATTSAIERFAFFLSPGALLTTRLLGVATLAYLCVRFITEKAVDFQNLFFLGVLAAFAFSAVNLVSYSLGVRATNFLKEIKPRSTICLTAADTSATESHAQNGGLKLAKSLSYQFSVVSVGLLVNFISYLLGH